MTGVPQQYIEVAEESAITPWQFKHPETGVVFASTFQLRVVTSDVQRALRKKHTKYDFVRGSRQENFDWARFNDDCLDYAIVDWADVKQRGVDLECTRTNKIALPEMVKMEITRLCLGKELGQVIAGEVGEFGREELIEGEGSVDPLASGPRAVMTASAPSGGGSTGSPTTDRP